MRHCAVEDSPLFLVTKSFRYVNLIPGIVIGCTRYMCNSGNLTVSDGTKILLTEINQLSSLFHIIVYRAHVILTRDIKLFLPIGIIFPWISDRQIAMSVSELVG